MKNSMEEDLWEDTTAMGRQQEGLLTAAEYKRMEETSRG
jgi:hypothetical protein